MRTITYITPDGTAWPLTEHDWTSAIEHGGISGLVGETRDQVITGPDLIGQILDSQDIGPMTGGLTVYIAGDETRSADKMWRELRAGLSTAKGREGTLVISSERAGRVYAKVRLQKIVGAPESDPDDETVLKIVLPLVCDDGVWWTAPMSAPGQAVVHNSGDVYLEPRIHWSGSGGQVKVPSGASFTLPAVGSPRIFECSSAKAFAVLRMDGSVDYELLAQLALTALPEGIPPGQSRAYSLPAGAVLIWQLGYLDPWQ